jgi:hypothetical protein
LTSSPRQECLVEKRAKGRRGQHQNGPVRCETLAGKTEAAGYSDYRGQGILVNFPPSSQVTYHSFQSPPNKNDVCSPPHTARVVDSQPQRPRSAIKSSPSRLSSHRHHLRFRLSRIHHFLGHDVAAVAGSRQATHLPHPRGSVEFTPSIRAERVSSRAGGGDGGVWCPEGC